MYDADHEAKDVPTTASADATAGLGRRIRVVTDDAFDAGGADAGGFSSIAIGRNGVDYAVDDKTPTAASKCPSTAEFRNGDDGFDDPDRNGCCGGGGGDDDDRCHDGTPRSKAEASSPSKPMCPPLDQFVVSPASSSLGASPSRESAGDGSLDDDARPYVDFPPNPIRLNFRLESPMHADDDGAFDTNGPVGNDGSTSIRSVDRNAPTAIAAEETREKEEAIAESISSEGGGGRTSPTLSLSLSVMSGYDTEEDEDGVMRRYGSQIFASARNAVGGLRVREDDDESVYSAINQADDGGGGDAANVDESRPDRSQGDDGGEFVRTTSRGSTAASGNSRKQSRHGSIEGGTGDNGHGSPSLRDVLSGMRRAQFDARRRRATRRFLALSEGRRSACARRTETACLSPWCDPGDGRGALLLAGLVALLVVTAVAAAEAGYAAAGVGVFMGGAVAVLLRYFWVPIHWLVRGRFTEKRRQRVMELYDTLNGEHPGGIEIPMHETVRDVEFSNEDKLSTRIREGIVV